ncbi:CGNR zinc finger domain-containing protein [Phytohabitans suffuscus]|uniref:CGNR zinc finger domain-containing protein n=1 Tax=Phytohabitans suffuscus TaxID=624315 RepID=UPI001562F80B|nr:CGNR zinc finger domain-containing protein [Phytohabitans suffuscus]
MAASSSSAPGRLETVRRFVNTRDVEAGTDAIATPAGLAGWLRDAGILDAQTEATPAQVRQAGTLREALRDCLAANHSGAAMPPGTVAALNQAAERARVTLSITADRGWVARPRAAGVDGALGTLVTIVADAMTARTWSRLKVCVNDDCRWAFYDQSRARTGKWCSMRVCGNRAKQQSWRTRQDPGTP